MTTQTVPPYVRAATREFCAGTNHTTPHAVIDHGHKTLREWCELLDRHRNAPRPSSRPESPEERVTRQIRAILEDGFPHSRTAMAERLKINRTSQLFRAVLEQLVNDGSVIMTRAGGMYFYTRAC
ncbi:hypothetical protein [Deinococcus peraridilitoris]|uniref:Uncharacterized protein n=1 Tax=Deinococcus peraridilitoris (strain DSM 19664 / LMG 22246 / CIP 109416 / KR-200) TaxID=937777 RepID=K9ZYV7_DEIPD|nr:hypothetical protein [Deinococcus peraridilitoris]AFZ66087.1 hypothetical protein Deipe_0491 [Deinococcus peraridilitoris DSM 19664]